MVKGSGLSLLWLGFGFWAGNFRMLWVQPKKKKKVSTVLLMYLMHVDLIIAVLVSLNGNSWHWAALEEGRRNRSRPSDQ